MRRLTRTVTQFQPEESTYEDYRRCINEGLARAERDGVPPNEVRISLGVNGGFFIQWERTEEGEA